MKRLLGALAAVALALPAAAGAKGLVSLSVCGTDGCHTTRDRPALAHAFDSVAQANPGQKGPFFKLRGAIGEPGRRHAFGHVVSLWMPSLNVIRGDDGPFAGYTMPDPALKTVLTRLARGLHSFPAAELPPEPGQPQDAQVAEVVPAPRADSGGGASWAWALLAVPPLGLLLWRRRLT